MRKDRRRGRDDPRRAELARPDRAVHRPRRARRRRAPPAGHGVRRLRPDRAEPARGKPGAAVDAAAVPAVRAPADRAGRRCHRDDRWDNGERPLNTPDTVAEWAERIRGQVERFVDFDGTTGAIVENNLSWTSGLPAIDFLRDGGKHFSVNVMLARDTIRRRLDGEGISYTEFSYMLLQANDYVELHERYGCTLQIGGSDQWGNIIAGVRLVRQKRGATVHALTVPLVTSADGTKFGKSTGGGSLWLDPDMTSPYAWYQYFVNTADA